MAAKWEEFAQDGDRYNLQYRTQNDDKVRPEHAALDGVTLPPSDPFWEEFYPPNGWNCRCTVVQVRKSKYPATPHDEAMTLGDIALQKDSKGIFHFNPGMEQKTLPDFNPYTIRRCRDCDIAKGKTKLARITPPDNQLCQACSLIREMVEKEAEIGIDLTEKKVIKAAAKEWAESHLPEIDNGGQIAKRLIIHHNSTGLDFVLNKKFFGETYSNCVRAKNTAETMEYAVRIEEWFQSLAEVGFEEGIHHDFKFKVMKGIVDGKTIEAKAKINGNELILYTIRIYN